MTKSKPGKERIRMALLALLGRKPLQQISITELCDAAQVSRSAFYANYPNLDDLYLSLVKDLLSQTSTLKSRLRYGDALDEEQFINRPLCAIVREPRDLKGLIGDDRFIQALLDTCQDEFMNESLDLYLDVCKDPKIARALFLFQITGCISAAKVFGSSSDWSAIQHSLDAFIRGGLAAANRELPRSSR